MAETTTDRSLATVRKFMNAIFAGNLDEARSLLKADVVVHAAPGLPYSGEYHGPQGLFELLARISEFLELTPSRKVRYLMADDTVAAHYRATFAARASGEGVEMGVVEVFTVGDGLIVEVDVYYKNPSAIAMLLAQ